MSQKIRRASALMIQPRERMEWDVSRLFRGESALETATEWIVFAAHLGREVAVDDEELLALAKVEEARWQTTDAIAGRLGAEVTARLIAKGLLVTESTDANSPGERDARLRASQWHPIASVAHLASRWSGVGDGEDVTRTRHRGMTDLVSRHGLPPPHLHARREAAARLPLDAPPDTALDALLRDRVTCRNFARDAVLPRHALGALLARTFGCQAQVEVAPNAWLAKKNHPSGGGLHPLEAYLVLRDVEGLADGLYHYHAGDHALEPLGELPRDAAHALAVRCVAGQGFFADAQITIAIVPRFLRTFWKYRAHPKAYRVVTLEAGHLSQNLYLAATELGLGAYVTAAINEADIEAAFGLDGLEESPLAVCGVGIRAARRAQAELDPLARIWPSEPEK